MMILLFILASRKVCFVLVVVVVHPGMIACFVHDVVDDIVVHPGIQESLFCLLLLMMILLFILASRKACFVVVVDDDSCCTSWHPGKLVLLLLLMMILLFILASRKVCRISRARASYFTFVMFLILFPQSLLLLLLLLPPPTFRPPLSSC